MHTRYDVKEILCDPYQLHRSIMTLQAAGVRIKEFPQSTANTTAMGQTLFELLKGRNLRVYPDTELRTQALNTVAMESRNGGFRIAKEKASRKIDSTVALSMACVAALERMSYVPLIFVGGGAESLDSRTVNEIQQETDAALALAAEESRKRSGTPSR
jgi:phage terminase large subunit-like protein